MLILFLSLKTQRNVELMSKLLLLNLKRMFSLYVESFYVIEIKDTY